MKTALLFLLAALVGLTTHAAPTSRLPAEWFVPLDTDTGRFALVDAGTGVIRVGTMTPAGVVAFPQVVPTGISSATDVASGITGTNGEEVFLTSPSANRVMRVSLGQAGAVSSVFSPVAGIGLSGLSESGLPASRRLLIASGSNGVPAFKVEQRDPVTGALIAQTNHGDAITRLEPMTNPADGSRFGISLFSVLNNGVIRVVQPPQNREIFASKQGVLEMITDVLGSAGARHVIAFRIGTASAHILTPTPPITSTAAFANEAASLPFAVSALIRVPGGGGSPMTDGFIALAADGGQAAWVRVNAAGNGFLTTTHSFTPDAGSDITGLLPLAQGVVKLSGVDGLSTSFKGMTFDGSNWITRSSGSLPVLPAITAAAATLLFLDQNPSVNPGARLIGIQNAPDWTRRTNALPLPGSVSRESFISSSTGLRFSTTQTVQPPPGTGFVIANQMDASMSVSTLGSASSLLQPSLRVDPPSSSFESSFRVTAAFDEQGFLLRFQRDGGAWQDWPGSLPVGYTTTLNFSLSPRTGGTPGPIVTRSYIFTANKLSSQDSDGDGVPDFVELAQGLDPFSGPDGDNDGVSDLDELIKGTDAADKAQRPALDDRDRVGDTNPDDPRQGQLIPSNDHVLRAVGLRIAANSRDFENELMSDGQEIRLHSLSGSLLASAKVARFNPPFPNLPDGSHTAARLESGLAISRNELVSLSTPLSYFTSDGEDGRESIRFLTADAPPGLEVTTTPTGTDLGNDAKAWINAARVAAASIPFARTSTVVKPKDAAVSVLLEHLVHDALTDRRPDGSKPPEIAKFTFMPSRAADAGRTPFTEADKVFLLNLGFSFEAALKLALLADLPQVPPLATVNPLTALADGIFNRHATAAPTSIGIEQPIDVLRLVLRGDDLPSGFEGAATPQVIGNARTAYNTAISSLNSAFRPSSKFRLTVPEVFLGAGVYLRDVGGELEPTVVLRKGERFEFEQGLGVQPGTVFDVTGFTDLPPDAGRTVIDATSVVFVSKPDVLDKDSDTDGLDDEWERFFFGTLALNGSFIPPGKTQTLAQAFATGADPRSLSGDPEIELEQPAGSALASGGTRDFGVTAIGSARDLVFTVKNTGGADLTGLGITIDGAGAGQFSVVSPPVSPVTPFGSTTMTVRFLPTSSGVKTAVLHVASNDPNEASYDITITGNGVAVGLPNPVINPPLTGANLVAVATQPDGRFLVGGTFGITGSPALNLARLNADGTVDSSFNIGMGADNSVACINVLLGGKILVAGSFANFNGTLAGRIVRLNADGSRDTSFNTGSGFGGAVAGIAVQADGKMIVVGSFSAFNGQARNRLVRLNTDGSLDTSFNIGSGPDNNLRTAEVQADGRILVAGDFANFNGQARNRLVRLNADGSLESTATFNIGTGPNSTLRAMSVLPDGRIMIAGDFGSVNGITRGKIAVLTSSGAVDTNFGDAAINSSVHSFMRQTDGKVLLGGFFTTVAGQTRNRVARLTSTGALDTSLSIGTGPNNTVNGLALTGTGQVIVVGIFTSVNGSARNGVAVLVNSIPATSITAPNRTRIEWARSGTAPEIAEADFDLSTDNGVTFTPLGKARFIAGGWDMDELNLPDTGIIRVRGSTRGGLGNASGGFVQSTVAFVMNAASEPTISAIANVTTAEDVATAAIAFTVADADTAPENLQVSASSSNGTLLPQSGISLGGSGDDRTITLSPAANQSGTADVTVSVFDGFRTTTRSFSLTVTAVNDLPTISSLTNETVPVGTGSRTQSLVVSDVETATSALSVSATSSNNALVPAANLNVTSTGGGGRTVTYRAVAGQVGSSTITLSVSDGTGARQTSFLLTMTNTAPTIAANVTSRTLNEDTILLASPFTIGDLETPDALSLSVRTSDATLVPESGIEFSGTGSSRSFRLTPATNRSGTVIITLIVSDGLLTSELPLTFTILPVNDTPTISPIADVTVLEDTASPPIPFTVFDVEGDPLTISHLALSGSIQGLVPSVVFTENPRTLTLIPNANANGQLAFSVRVSDPSSQPGSLLILGNSSSFTFTVTPVNDAPSFTKGQNFTHPFGFDEAQSISGWATNISAGPANESDQALAFRITANSNPALFTEAPFISNGGDLSYQTAGSAGTATITLALEDSGGTENGGVDTSATQTFTISVGAALPRIEVAGNLGVALEDGAGVFDVGSATVGGSVQQTLQIKNTGEAALSLTGITLDGADAALFTLTLPAFPTFLAPGSSLPLLVSLSPVRSGGHVAALHLASNDATAGAAFDLTLTGRGSLAPTVNLRPPAEITRNSLLLTATVNAGGGDAEVTLELGTTPELGQTFPVTPSSVSGGSQVLVSSRPTGLRANTLYFYRITAENSAGAAAAEGVFFTSNVVPGSLDLPFGLNPFYDGTVKAIAVQPDGKILIGGDFVTFVEVRTDLARLHPDGTLDLTFDAQLDPAAGRGVNAIAVQKDGSIVIGGNFETVGGAAQRLLARVEADGARDSSFAPTLAGNSVQRLAFGADGRILLGGRFTSVNGAARSSLARLETDGSLDAGFDPVLTGTALEVTSMALQVDGMILVGGEFTSVNAVPKAKLARLSDVGVLDESFATAVSGTIRSLLVQPDGRVVIGGAGLIVNGRGRFSLARVNSDGSTDEDFSTPILTRFIAPETIINDMAAQADGALIIAGDFFLNDTSNVARLLADGSADRDFTMAGRQAVECLAIQADGKVVLSGGFPRQNRFSSNGLARLLNDAVGERLAVLDDTQIHWLRGLAAPEVQTLDFSLSTDGGINFTDLGEGSRIPGGWSLVNSVFSGLTRYHLRVEGRAISGAGNGSAGRVRTLLAHNQPDIEVSRFSEALTDAAGTLDLGSVAISQTRNVASFQIRNTGTEPLSLGQITLDGAQAAEFTVNTINMRTSLEPGQVTTFELFITPAASGTRTAALHIASNDPDAENTFDITFSAVGTGPSPAEISIFTPAGTELANKTGTLDLGRLETTQNHAFTFLIKNSGATPLTNMSITKTGSADFTVSQPAAGTLGLNDSTVFTVSVKPAANGARTAFVKVASNDADENPFEINLSATGTVRDIAVAVTPGGELLDARGKIDFGNANVLNVPVQRTLTLRNTGTGPLTLGRVSITGVGYSISQPTKSILAPGGADTTTCELTFLPTSGAVSAGSIQIESDDRDEAIFDIALTGGGAGPEIDVFVVAGSSEPLVDGIDTVTLPPTTTVGISTRTLTLRNPSSVPLRVTGLSIADASPAGTPRFSVPQINRVINAGASFGVVINFIPNALGTFAATLNISSDDPDESTFEIRLTGECLASVQPFFTAHPQSQIVALGDPVKFTAAAGSPLPVAFQWQRGAASVTSFSNFRTLTPVPELTIPSAVLADALNYVVTAVNSVSSIKSDQAQLTVVDRAASRQSLEIKKQAIFTLKTAGPTGSRSFRWLKDGASIAADARITGVNTDKLTITNLNLNDSGIYVCEVSAPGGSLRGGDNTLEVFDIAPRIASNPLPLTRGQVGRAYRFQIPLDPEGGLATTYTATSLPAGLILSATTGLITGQPSLAGTSSFALTAKNTKGTSTVTATLTVDPLPLNLAGSYTGIIERNLINNLLGGRFDFTITSTAAYSGRITLGASVITIPPGVITLPDQGSLVPVSFSFKQGTGAAAITRRVTFTLNPLTNLISNGQINNAIAPLLVRPARFTAWRSPWTPLLRATAFQDYHTFGLEIPAGALGNEALPQGIGFGSFTTVINGGETPIVGKLADGTAFTSSSFLGPNGELAVFQNNSKSSLLGVISIEADSTVISGVTVTDNSLNGSLSWQRPATKDRTYSSGFSQLALTISGGTYRPAPASQNMLGTTLFGLPRDFNNARISFTEGGIGGPPSRADRLFLLGAGNAIFDSAGPPRFTLSTNKTIGTFTGKVTLEDPTVLVQPAGRVLRDAIFEGIVIKDAQGTLGSGFFLLPQMPFINSSGVIIPVTKTPILSGAVLLEPTVD